MTRTTTAFLMTSALQLVGGSSALAREPPSPADDQSQRTHASLSTQAIEIIGLDSGAHHITTVLDLGVSVAHFIAPRWTVVGSAGFTTGIDSVSLGGSTVVAISYDLHSSGPFRVGMGPDLGVVHLRERSESNAWEDISVVIGGTGVSLGFGSTTLVAGLGAGYTPQFGGAWSLAPRLGVSTSF